MVSIKNYPPHTIIYIDLVLNVYVYGLVWKGGRGAKKIAHCIDNGWYSLYYKKRHLPCVEYMGKYPCVWLYIICIIGLSAKPLPIIKKSLYPSFEQQLQQQVLFFFVNSFVPQDKFIQLNSKSKCTPTTVDMVDHVYSVVSHWLIVYLLPWLLSCCFADWWVS